MAKEHVNKQTSEVSDNIHKSIHFLHTLRLLILPQYNVDYYWK